MRARQVFMESLVAHGADCIFGNPGTTESPLLESLIDHPEIDYYVALHEGVAVCAASFYAKASGKTALANLHVAPGLGNAIGMMYAALKASAPVIVTAGQQDTRMRLRDPLLSHDLVAMAAPVAKWSTELRSADEVGPLMRRAFKIARQPPAGPVFVALPIGFDAVSPIPEDASVVQIEESAERLAYNFPLALGVVAHLDATLTRLTSAIADEANAGYRAARDERNRRLREQKEAQREGLAARLQALWDTTPMSPARAMHEIGAALPEDAVVVDESVTALLDVAQSFRLERPGDYYAGRGGGIGQGVAGALGVKAAHPDRPVVALSGDGSAMYSIQALWTAAHHDLGILFVILSNREYRVLKHNLDTYRGRFEVPADRPYPHMDLSDPVLGFAEMARGMGMPGRLVSKPEDLRDAVREALSAGGPFLLDVEISGKR